MPTVKRMRDADLSKQLSPQTIQKRQLKAAAERVNVYDPDSAAFPTQKVRKTRSDKLPPPSKLPRIRDPNEALPPANDLWERKEYRTGDGDTMPFQRPGSDHSNLKSFGNLT